MLVTMRMILMMLSLSLESGGLMPPWYSTSWSRAAVPYITTRWQGPATRSGSCLAPLGFVTDTVLNNGSGTAAPDTAFNLEAMPLSPLL